MPLNGSGTYNLQNPPVFPAVAGTTIKASDFNAIMNDMAAAISAMIARDGQSTITGVLQWAQPAANLAALGGVPLAGNATIAGVKTFSTSPVVPAGTAADHAVNKAQLDAATAGAFAAGDTKFSYQSADHGRWLMVTGPQRTVGNASSGATARANADTLALFTVLWALNPADVAIYDSTGAPTARGASAAADFAANKRIDLPNESGLVSKGHHGGNGALTTNTTRRLGSVEMDDVKAHTHVANIDANVGTSNSRSSNLVWGDRGPDSTKSVTTTSTGGPENLVRNRSKNAFIYF